MKLFNIPALVFALNCYVGAMLALAVAFAFSLPNPWWAALTVYITSQPMGAASGAVWARALWRTAGTVAGMAASLAIVPNLVDMPEVMVLALGAWLALCTYLSLLDRSPRAYAFMLAGYTTALVGLPLVSDPTRMFDVAVSRTEEIAIGVLCAAVCQTVFFPRRATDVLRAKLKASLADAQRWIVDALGPEAGSPAAAQQRRKLAADLGEVNLLSKTVRYERATSCIGGPALRSLEAAMVALLPLLVATEDRILTLRAQQGMSRELDALVAAIRGWVEQGGRPDDAARADALAAACKAAAPGLDAASTWSDLLRLDLTLRLARLVLAWRATTALAGLAPGGGDVPARALHVDHGLAVFAGLAAGVAVVATAAFVMAIGWAQGLAAVGITAAGCAVFAFADDPTPFLKLFIRVTVLAVFAAAFYVFAVFPLLDGFAMLAAALFPLFMLTGLFIATPKYWLHGLGFALVSQTLISLQPAASNDFVAFANLAFAALGGSISSLCVTLLIRVVGAHRSARRILRAGWKDIRRTAEDSWRVPDMSAWMSTMLDRQGQLIPRLAKLPADHVLRRGDVLTDLVLGMDLRALAATLGRPGRPELGPVLAGTARHFGALARRGPRPGPDALLGGIDRLLDGLLKAAPGAARSQSLSAAVGLRRGLFPDAPVFQPRGQPA